MNSGEVKLMRRAAEISARAHRRVMQSARDGMTEYHTAEVHQSELWDLMVLDEEIAWIGHRRAQLSKEAEAASDG